MLLPLRTAALWPGSRQGPGLALPASALGISSIEAGGCLHRQGSRDSVFGPCLLPGGGGRTPTQAPGALREGSFSRGQSAG